jgi:hypothetical protein
MMEVADDAKPPLLFVERRAFICFGSVKTQSANSSSNRSAASSADIQCQGLSSSTGSRNLDGLGKALSRA